MTPEVEHMGTLWFVSPEDGDRDWMGYTYKAKGDDTWRFRYRFRYHAEGKGNPFDGRDRKSFWEGTANDKGIEYLTQTMDSMAWKIALDWHCGVERLEIDGPTGKLVTMPNRPKWIHSKRVPLL